MEHCNIGLTEHQNNEEMVGVHTFYNFASHFSTRNDGNIKATVPIFFIGSPHHFTKVSTAN